MGIKENLKKLTRFTTPKTKKLIVLSQNTSEKNDNFKQNLLKYNFTTTSDYNMVLIILAIINHASNLATKKEHAIIKQPLQRFLTLQKQGNDEFRENSLFALLQSGNGRLLNLSSTVGLRAFREIVMHIINDSEKAEKLLEKIQHRIKRITRWKINGEDVKELLRLASNKLPVEPTDEPADPASETVDTGVQPDAHDFDKLPAELTDEPADPAPQAAAADTPPEIPVVPSPQKEEIDEEAKVTTIERLVNALNAGTENDIKDLSQGAPNDNSLANWYRFLCSKGPAARRVCERVKDNVKQLPEDLLQNVKKYFSMLHKMLPGLTGDLCRCDIEPPKTFLDPDGTLFFPLLSLFDYVCSLKRYAQPPSGSLASKIKPTLDRLLPTVEIPDNISGYSVYQNCFSFANMQISSAADLQNKLEEEKKKLEKRPKEGSDLYGYSYKYYQEWYDTYCSNFAQYIFDIFRGRPYEEFINDHPEITVENAKIAQKLVKNQIYQEFLRTRKTGKPQMEKTDEVAKSLESKWDATKRASAYRNKDYDELRNNYDKEAQKLFYTKSPDSDIKYVKSFIRYLERKFHDLSDFVTIFYFPADPENPFNQERYWKKITELKSKSKKEHKIYFIVNQKFVARGLYITRGHTNLSIVLNGKFEMIDSFPKSPGYTVAYKKLQEEDYRAIQADDESCIAITLGAVESFMNQLEKVKKKLGETATVENIVKKFGEKFDRYTQTIAKLPYLDRAAPEEALLLPKAYLRFLQSARSIDAFLKYAEKLDKNADNYKTVQQVAKTFKKVKEKYFATGHIKGQEKTINARATMKRYAELLKVKTLMESLKEHDISLDEDVAQVQEI